MKKDVITYLLGVKLYKGMYHEPVPNLRFLDAKVPFSRTNRKDTRGRNLPVEPPDKRPVWILALLQQTEDVLLMCRRGQLSNGLSILAVIRVIRREERDMMVRTHFARAMFNFL